MTEPYLSGIADRQRGWFIERGILVASVVFMVLGAANADSTVGVLTLVAASAACLSLAGLAWYKDDVTASEVIVFALIARVLAFPLLPGLSDDGYRYIWDGWLQANGINPFLYIPSDNSLAAFQQDELYARLNSPGYYSVYPPSSQLAFWIGGFLKGEGWVLSWYAIKLSFIVIEFVGILFLSRILAPRYAVLYAWHPLAIIEGSGQGHTEIAMVGALFICLYAFENGRYKTSLTALTVAAWFKLYPVVLVPFLIRRVGWRLLWVPLIVSTMLWIPFVDQGVLTNVRSSLNLYVQLFEFNAGPYYLLKWLGEVATGADLSKLIGPLLQFSFLISTVAVFTYDAVKPRARIQSVWLVILGLFLATSTTVHPWYILAVLAIVPFAHSRFNPALSLSAFAWLWLSIASLATYLRYATGETAYWVAVYVGWLGWGLLLCIAAGTALLPRLMQYRARSKWQWVSRHIQPTDSILDLGAGDGYVGDIAQKSIKSSQVILSDVVDFNQTDLPFVLYDGYRLPFADDALDTTLLAYVLHHAEDPDRVLRETRRVTSSQVAVLESIIETKLDRWWLTFADTAANRLRSKGKMKEQPLNFGTVEEWRSRFASAGFEIIAEQRKGYFFHKRHLFILR